MRAFYTVQIATQMLNIRNCSVYVLSEGKWRDVKKSLFQLAKMQKMNITKNIRDKYRTNFSLKFEFSNRHVYNCH